MGGSAKKLNIFHIECLKLIDWSDNSLINSCMMVGEFVCENNVSFVSFWKSVHGDMWGTQCLQPQSSPKYRLFLFIVGHLDWGQSCQSSIISQMTRRLNAWGKMVHHRPSLIYINLQRNGAIGHHRHRHPPLSKQGQFFYNRDRLVFLFYKGSWR